MLFQAEEFMETQYKLKQGNVLQPNFILLALTHLLTIIYILFSLHFNEKKQQLIQSHEIRACYCMYWLNKRNDAVDLEKKYVVTY